MKELLKKSVFFVCAVCLFSSFAVACGKTDTLPPPLTLSETKVSAFVGETYDLKGLITDYDATVTYTALGEYFAIDSAEFIQVTFEGLSFTLEEEASFTAEISAAKDGKESKAQVEVTVGYRTDAVDEDIVATWCDPELQKMLNHDEAYLRGDSYSSVKLKYVGVNSHPAGVIFNAIDGTLLDKHWSITKEADPEKAWENAVVSFWVYNPGDAALQFCPRLTHMESGADIEWKEEIVKTAAPKQWTHIYFSYRALGITTNFFFDEEGYFAPGGKQEDDYDANYMKIQSADAPSDGTKMYTFTAYIDDYDIVAYNDETKDLFPGLDTTKPEASELVDLTNLQYNEPGGAWTKDTQEHSTQSGYSQKIFVEGNYADRTAIFNIWSQNWKELDLTKATLRFDIKFGGAADGGVTLSFDTTSDDKISKNFAFSVTSPAELSEGILVVPVAGAEGWYRVSIDCDKVKALFENENFRMDSVRKFKVNFTRTGTEEAWANFDNLFVDMFAKAEEKV